MLYNIHQIESFEADIIYPNFELNAWIGHRNFAYDLVKFVKPKNIVELGTHYGCSFFAMAQAIKDFSLKTTITAVDNWLGEEHAGFYDESVFNVFQQIIKLHYNKINIDVKQMFFEEALKQYDNEYFDIIHIDGLHTYEAVQDDFTTWLPKLKKNGIVLFHDVYSLPHFGTNRFWQEIKQQYEYHFEFTHCFGLGVLFPKGNVLYDKMIENKFKEVKPIYEHKFLMHESKLRSQQAQAETELVKQQLNASKIESQQAQAETELVKQQLNASKIESQQAQAETELVKQQLNASKIESQQALYIKDQYLSKHFTNNTLWNIIINRLREKIVHEKWAKNPR